MCDPTTILVSSAIGAVGKIHEGQAKKRAAYAEADEYEYQADIALSNAQAEAKVIEREGRLQRGETLGGFAAAGVKIGEFSALDVEREVMEDAARDRAMAILSGQRVATSHRRSAAAKRRAGSDAATAGWLRGAGSLVKAGRDYVNANNWPQPHGTPFGELPKWR